jgi:cytochrome c553
MMRRWTGALVFSLLIATVYPSSSDTIEEKAAVCAACHGDNGVPKDKTIPIIWGQNEGYLYIELRDMKKGVRKNNQMAPLVEDMERDDMLALAAYFAARPWPNLDQPRASAEDANRFAVMANSGQCPACHQAEFKGAGTQPRLAGQSYAYLIKTMSDFRSGARANNDWMTSLMRTFSEDDIARMARVLSGL